MTFPERAISFNSTGQGGGDSDNPIPILEAARAVRTEFLFPGPGDVYIQGTSWPTTAAATMMSAQTTMPGAVMQRIHRLILTAVVLAVWGAIQTGAARAAQYDAGKLPYAVTVNGIINPYRIMSVFVLPGASVDLTPIAGTASRPFDATADGGTLRRDVMDSFQWRAPAAPGDYVLRIIPGNGEPEMRINAFVMVPALELAGERLDGYLIGRYPTKARQGLAIYRAPRGFVRVTPQNAATPVSPHFTLGQFLCKEAGGFPKFVVLRRKLLMKLETILERLNAAGIAASRLTVMSGYRTPAYNSALGNVVYSRHQWGGAADIFVDVNPHDGRMDDLNGDGRVDRADADWLYQLVDGVTAQPAHAGLVGGLGQYSATRYHGPFVHVDVRGMRARWGAPQPARVVASRHGREVASASDEGR